MKSFSVIFCSLFGSGAPICPKMSSKEAMKRTIVFTLDRDKKDCQIQYPE
jgi:hypothetical protein